MNIIILSTASGFSDFCSLSACLDFFISEDDSSHDNDTGKKS